MEREFGARGVHLALAWKHTAAALAKPASKSGDLRNVLRLRVSFLKYLGQNIRPLLLVCLFSVLFPPFIFARLFTVKRLFRSEKDSLNVWSCSSKLADLYSTKAEQVQVLVMFRYSFLSYR